MIRTTASALPSALDPLLGLSLLSLLAGALACWLFAGQVPGDGRWGAATLYLLWMPGALVLARALQLGQRARLPAVRKPPRTRRMAMRRRRPVPRRPLRVAMAAAVLAPLPR